MSEDNIELDLSGPENLDWVHGESEDLWDRLNDSEREERAFQALVSAVESRLEKYGVKELVTKIAV